MYQQAGFSYVKDVDTFNENHIKIIVRIRYTSTIV